MTLPLAILLPFLGALLPPVLIRRGRTLTTAATLLVPLASLALLASHWPDVSRGDVPRWQLSWIPRFGIHLDVRLDGLAFLFGALVFGIGALIVLYARYYLSEEDSMGRFYSYLLLFMGAMAGLVLTGNLLLLAIFWELTSLSSFLLIGFWTHRADARDGARTSLIVTGLGGLALLGGVLIIGRVVGSFDIGVVIRSGELLRSSSLYLPALLLVLIGAFTKSAQFPFHFWLPGAMAAPTPVSAYLHSAAMVKAGVFVLARLHPALSGTSEWFWIVTGTGLVTLLLGAYSAMMKNDLKGLLAYSTISHLGLITLLLGIGSTSAVVAAVFHVMNHVAFKASLFMAAGIIDHEAGTRDLRTLNGLWRLMPYTAVLAVVAAAAMAGVPLFNGFLSKEMFFTESLELTGAGAMQWIVPVGATLFGVFSAAYSIRFVYEVFFSGPGTGMPRVPHEPPRWMRVPVELLALVCVLVGLFPNTMVRPLLDVSAAAVAGTVVPAFNLTQWHGLNTPLLMSLTALAGGIALFFLLRDKLANRGAVGPLVSAKHVFDRSLAGTTNAAGALTGFVANGSLQRYALYLVVTALTLGLTQAWKWGWPRGSEPSLPVDIPTATGASVLVMCALATVLLHRRRLIALITISGVGAMSSLAFVRFGAPDLALTQLMVEVVATLLMLLALFYLPQREPRMESAPRLARDGAVALASGAGVAAIVWTVLSRPLDSISSYFVQNSQPLGGGTNIVNVILVDFRGFDTMGEIAVIGTAALGIRMMLDGLDMGTPVLPASWSRTARSLTLISITRAMLPFALLMSVYLFLRGHNQPGGGFVAGLLTAIAIVLQYLGGGMEWTLERVRRSPQPWIAWGVLIAVGTGVIGMISGSYFLDLAFTHVHVPVIGDIELATAALFDLGVYVTVVAAVLLIISGIGALSPSPEPADTIPGSDPWRI
jgi:multicomponent K+:H+ antiporter subunit A